MLKIFSNNLPRKVTSLREGHTVPPTDSLLRFLVGFIEGSACHLTHVCHQVESSSDEFPSCANCDRNEKTPMFFCNTCGQFSSSNSVQSRVWCCVVACRLVFLRPPVSSTDLSQETPKGAVLRSKCPKSGFDSHLPSQCCSQTRCWE